MNLSYYELKDLIKSIIPRKSLLEDLEKGTSIVKEKGRKSNYRQTDLSTGKMELQERNLNMETMNSFLEVSLRAPHCVAEGQMVRIDIGNIPIEKIKIGDKIASFHIPTKQIEFQRVGNIFSSLREDMVEIETESGKLIITSDHPLLTKKGWKLAKELTENDEILEME